MPLPGHLQRQHPGARPAAHRRPWQEDPGCYLDNAEIGVADDAARLEVKPWVRLTPRPERLQVGLQPDTGPPTPSG
jgi:hypothetical protein